MCKLTILPLTSSPFKIQRVCVCECEPSVPPANSPYPCASLSVWTANLTGLFKKTKLPLAILRLKNNLQ